MTITRKQLEQGEWDKQVRLMLHGCWVKTSTMARYHQGREFVRTESAIFARPAGSKEPYQRVEDV